MKGRHPLLPRLDYLTLFLQVKKQWQLLAQDCPQALQKRDRRGLS
jgi:hypothetical protein